ncbi:MAG: methyltransferase domain-containing protein [Sedimentisphaerales bacterium]|nr:methyltransferase domain-containing protein [Sedimentisphaerales bacterium]
MEDASGNSLRTKPLDITEKLSRYAMLNEIENDLIEFIAARRQRPIDQVRSTFIHVRDRYDFTSRRFAELYGGVHEILSIMYMPTTEADLVDCYHAYAFFHLLRYLSSTYPKPKSSLVKEFWRDVKKGRWQNFYHFIKRKIAGKKSDGQAISKRASQAQAIVERITGPATVVDYGCGLGFISFEIAKLKKGTKVYLVDVDNLIREFTLFRFRKHGIDAETISVTRDCIYPELPEHNICIATEVMEHVRRPLEVYGHIRSSMQKGGILMGNFVDHQKDMLHVSPDLRELRDAISKDYKELDYLIYQKQT